MEQKTDIIDTKQITVYLINNCVSYKDIKACLEDTQLMDTLSTHLKYVQDQDDKMKSTDDNKIQMQIISHVEQSFTNLERIGIQKNWKSLVTISKTSTFATQLYRDSKQLFSMNFAEMFINPVSLFEPLALITNMTLRIMNFFSKDESINVFAEFSRIISSLAQHIDRRFDMIHEHLDVLHSDIIQIASMIGLCLTNQKHIYELQCDTIKLIKSSFTYLNNYLTDWRITQQHSLNDINSKLEYIITVGELKDYKDSIKQINEISHSIKVLNVLQLKTPLSSRIPMIEDRVSNLESLIPLICSNEWNGLIEYTSIKNNSKLSLEYIARRIASGDYCTSILANYYTALTGINLNEHKINISQLFNNVVWTNLISNITDVIRSKSISHYDFEETIRLIHANTDNTIRFVDYIRTHIETIITQIKVRHTAVLNSMMYSICRIYNSKKKDITDSNPLTIKELVGDMLCNQIYDLNLICVINKLFCCVANYRGIDLIDSNYVTTQKYVFTDSDPITSYFIKPYKNNTHEQETKLDPIGGFINDNKIIFHNDKIIFSHIATTQSCANYNCGRIMININEIDINTNSSLWTIHDSYDTKQQDIPDKIEYKHMSKWPLQLASVTSRSYCGFGDNVSSNTSPQVWIGYHMYYRRFGGPYLVIYSPGTSEVAMLNLCTHTWDICDNSRYPALLSIPFDGRLCISTATLFQTCLTNLIDSNLFINIFNWDQNNTKVTLRCEVFDLYYKKWNDEKSDLRANSLCYEKKNSPNPNYFFVQNICELEWALENGYIIGNFSLSDNKEWIYLNIISRRYYGNWTIHESNAFETNVASVNQTQSTITKSRKIIVVASIETTEKKHKLLIFTTTKNKYTEFKMIEHSIPHNTNSPDEQCLRLNNINIHDIEYVLISILGTSYNAQLYIFNSIDNTINHLGIGPRICKEDTIPYCHLTSSRRQNKPGFYPIRNYAVNVINTNNFLTVYFTFTKLGSINMKNTITISYKLCPILKSRRETKLQLNNSGLMLSLMNTRLSLNQQLLTNPDEKTEITDGKTEIKDEKVEIRDAHGTRRKPKKRMNIDTIIKKLKFNVQILKSYTIPQEYKDVIVTTLTELDVCIIRLETKQDVHTLCEQIIDLVDQIDIVYKRYVPGYNISENISRLIQLMKQY
jgi:hypothetical protein